jgi:hypothetical protein
VHGDRRWEGLYLPFDLSIKNDDDLCESSRHVPLILVVVCVPPDLGDWLEETPEHTAMRRCAYWFSARGQPPTTNTTSCRSDSWADVRLSAVVAPAMITSGFDRFRGMIVVWAWLRGPRGERDVRLALDTPCRLRDALVRVLREDQLLVVLRDHVPPLAELRLDAG